MDDKILTWDDYQDEPEPRFAKTFRRGAAYAQYVETYYKVNLGQPPPVMPDSLDRVAPMFVDGGRWVAQCPGCRGGVPAPTDPGEPVICVQCGAGGWGKPLWPIERYEIDAELLRMPGFRYFAPVRQWRPGWTLDHLCQRTERAWELFQELPPFTLLRALSIGATRVWLAGEVLSAANMNLYISDPIDDISGDNGLVEFRDAISASYIVAPGGTTIQRPSPQAGLLRWNTEDLTFDLGGASDYQQMLNSGAVTYANLDANGDVGGLAGQLSPGIHSHTTGPVDIHSDTIAGFVTTDYVELVNYTTVQTGYFLIRVNIVTFGSRRFQIRIGANVLVTEQSANGTFYAGNLASGTRVAVDFKTTLAFNQSINFSWDVQQLLAT